MVSTKDLEWIGGGVVIGGSIGELSRGKLGALAGAVAGGILGYVAEQAVNALGGISLKGALKVAGEISSEHPVEALVTCLNTGQTPAIGCCPVDAFLVCGCQPVAPCGGPNYACAYGVQKAWCDLKSGNIWGFLTQCLCETQGGVG